MGVFFVLIVVNDQMVLGVLDVFCVVGVLVLQDVFVIGFDGIEVMVFFVLFLIMICQFMIELGCVVVQVFVCWLEQCDVFLLIVRLLLWIFLWESLCWVD